MEVVSKRTAFSKTFRNADGTFTDKITATPRNFRTADGWVEIDNSLVAEPGGLRNKSNAFSTRFRNIAEGVRIETADGTISMAPLGAATSVTPTVDATGRTASYPEAWPGVDLRYRVEATMVKEDIVFQRRPSSNEFAFSIGGTTVTSSADGGLAAGGTLAGKWAVAPPVVFDKSGKAVPEAAPTFKVDGPVVTVSVDAAWLSALPDDAFPVTLDPTWWSVGSPNSQGYVGTSGGWYTCAPCQIKVGQPQANGWTAWRSTAYFPYEDVIGTQVLDAQVDLSDRWEGTASPTWIDVYHGSWDWPNLGAYLGSAVADDSFSLNTEELRAFYDCDDRLALLQSA